MQQLTAWLAAAGKTIAEKAWKGVLCIEAGIARLHLWHGALMDGLLAVAIASFAGLPWYGRVAAFGAGVACIVLPGVLGGLPESHRQ